MKPIIDAVKAVYGSNVSFGNYNERTIFVKNTDGKIAHIIKKAVEKDENRRHFLSLSTASSVKFLRGTSRITIGETVYDVIDVLFDFRNGTENEAFNVALEIMKMSNMIKFINKPKPMLMVDFMSVNMQGFKGDLPAWKSLSAMVSKLKTKVGTTLVDLPMGFFHGEIRNQNVIRNTVSDKIYYLVDFAECGKSYRLMDVAFSLYAGDISAYLWHHKVPESDVLHKLEKVMTEGKAAGLLQKELDAFGTLVMLACFWWEARTVHFISKVPKDKCNFVVNRLVKLSKFMNSHEMLRFNLNEKVVV